MSAVEAIAQLERYLMGLHPMPEEMLRQGTALFRTLQLPKGALLLREGKICRELAFVHSGLLRAFSLRDDGQELTSCFAMKNDFICDYNSFVHQVPASKSLQALEDCCILTITRPQLQQLQEEHSAWRHLGKILTDKEFTEKEKWANRLRISTAAERYNDVLTEQPGLVNRVPVHQLASYLGVTTRTLSRVRKALSTTV